MSQNQAIQQVILKIDGMSCSSCSNSIEKKLNTLEGIHTASINIATERAQVAYDPNTLALETILATIDQLGYKSHVDEPVEMQTVTLKVNGMSCTVCSGKVEKTLSEMNGVLSAHVNFSAEKATITYNPKFVRLIDFQKQISVLGYSLDINEDENEGLNEAEIKMAKSKKIMIISSGFSGVIMGLMMIHMFVIPIPGYLPITAILGFPILFGTGLKVHIGSFKALKNKSPNMDVLVTLGSLPPYLLGLLGLFFPIQAFIEMATTIMTFHLIGKYLEARAKGRASQAIKKLLEMGAKTAKIIINGEEVELPTKDLQVGDIMVIRPGEKIPTDGVVLEGHSLLDESMATGESMPVKRGIGDEVIGATINKQGLLKVRVTKIGKDTFLSQVVKMMEACQGSKVPIQEFADRITGYFVPAIIIITIITFISFNLFTDFHLGIITWASSFLPWVNPELSPLTLAFVAATAVLVISCPCALGLGTPTALMVGSGIGAENGILIRNGEAIQTIKEVKVIAFDKTGTLTKGKPEVTDLINLNGADQQTCLYYAASIEHGSEHPLAFAIVEKANQEKIQLGHLTNFESVTGMGVKGVIDGETIFVGNRAFMRANQVPYETHENDLIALEESAKTAMLIAKGNTLIGLVAVADPIKSDSAKTIQALEAMGIKTAMITGDNQRTATAIAKQVGITLVIAEVLPDGKVQEVQNLQKQYGTVAMVGDGINDAPALKQANVGIAIGTGTDIAIEAADVTLVRGELSSILSTIKLSKAIFRKIRQNYFWAWFYNALFIPVAALGLLHPMLGAAAMGMSSLNVVYNSLRLRKVDIS